VKTLPLFDAEKRVWTNGFEKSDRFESRVCFGGFAAIPVRIGSPFDVSKKGGSPLFQLTVVFVGG